MTDWHIASAHNAVVGKKNAAKVVAVSFLSDTAQCRITCVWGGWKHTHLCTYSQTYHTYAYILAVVKAVNCKNTHRTYVCMCAIFMHTYICINNTHVQSSADSECSHCLLFLQEFKNSLTAFYKIAGRMCVRVCVSVYVKHALICAHAKIVVSISEREETWTVTGCCKH